jgi:hypothetical protein
MSPAVLAQPRPDLAGVQSPVREHAGAPAGSENYRPQSGPPRVDVLLDVYLDPIEAAGERRRNPHFGANA